MLKLYKTYQFCQCTWWSYHYTGADSYIHLQHSAYIYCSGHLSNSGTCSWLVHAHSDRYRCSDKGLYDSGCKSYIDYL